MRYGFIRAACASPGVIPGDCAANSRNIAAAAQEAAARGAEIIVFPELSITGYTCGDLFLQTRLRREALKGLEFVAQATAGLDSLIFAGLPLELEDGIYNCAAALSHGKIAAIIPKSYLPNYGEFYEKRQFRPFRAGTPVRKISAGNTIRDVPFGTDIIITEDGENSPRIACEICEDLWVPVPPSSVHALSGADVIVNLSAGNEIIGKAAYRRNLVSSHSARTICAYLYANAGNGESTQDMVFASHNIIAENGTVLAESGLFSGETIYADIDIERIRQERLRTTSFSDSAAVFGKTERYTVINGRFSGGNGIPPKGEKLLRRIESAPFVPSGKEARTERCGEVIALQAQGLAKRLRHINCRSAVIGLSGGLDSTLALLVTAKAFDICGIPRACIHSVTMPCFGTTDRTYTNACALAAECGTNLREINISESVMLHFRDIGHNPDAHDVTYENSQARERTQVLMDIANSTGGIVIGTGDLSELALGWCTYNGDQMSMYGVNTSVPKTLVRYLVEWFADEAQEKKLGGILRDILDTPVSPELIPPEDGRISQVTEDIVGPYILHDFFLYYVLRFGFSPEKILFLAGQTDLPYTRHEILRWMRTFYRRFFSQQFKRSCMPDGAKVGTVNLSPRGDWRMPSDASAAAWTAETERLMEGEKC